MATITQRKKIKALFEQSMADGGLDTFKQNWDKSLGIENLGAGRQRLNFEQREVDHNDFHVGEVCHALMGNDWRDNLTQFATEANQRRFEGQGGQIMGGELSLVSASLDVIAGLMNARALQAAAAPDWIWDRMCTVEEASGEGGFHIGLRAMNDPHSTDLADGQSLPTAHTVQTRIHRNRTLNQGQRVKVNLWAVRDDLTGQIMEAVDNTSLMVLAERERKVADAVLGISATSGAANTKALTVSAGQNIGTDGLAMPVVQDGLSFFPYQKGIYGASGANAGAVILAPENDRLIQNFANATETDALGLTDYNALVKGLQILLANLDPFTVLPVPISLQGSQFFVAPAAAVQLKFLLEAETLWQVAANLTAAGGKNTVSSYNFVEELKLNVISSQYWANRLTSVGVTKLAANGTYSHQTLTNAVGDTFATAGSVLSAFYMGDFKRAVHYWQRMPYQVVQVPLSSIEFGEQTVIVQDQRERGQAFWVEPRAVYRAWA
jgi:hypothetical protein